MSTTTLEEYLNVYDFLKIYMNYVTPFYFHPI